jgi:hypothetical protein
MSILRLYIGIFASTTAILVDLNQMPTHFLRFNDGCDIPLEAARVVLIASELCYDCACNVEPASSV